MIGTVVYAGEVIDYEVEFLDSEGYTIDLVTGGEECLCLIIHVGVSE